jgi:hypothetical protein
LSEKEYLEEFANDSKKKKYYYSYNEAFDLPINSEKFSKNNESDVGNKVKYGMFNFMRKF